MNARQFKGAKQYRISNTEPRKCLKCKPSGVHLFYCTTKCKFDAIHLNRTHPEFANYINGDYAKQAVLKHGVKRVAKLTVKRITARNKVASCMKWEP